MESNLLNDQVIRFLSDYISSVAQLEILLLLQSNPQQRRTIEEIVRELRTDLAGTERELEHLCHNCLVKRGDSREYFYSPANPELHASAVALSQAYLVRRVTIIGLIFAKPPDSLRDFSDAFRLGKEPDDGANC